MRGRDTIVGLLIAVEGQSAAPKLVHNGLNDLFKLKDGVFPGLPPVRTLLTFWKKGRRKLVVIGPGDG